MRSWLKSGIPVEVIQPVPALTSQFYLAHDQSFVDGLMALKIANGFGNHSREVADSLPWTVGSLLTAARLAVENKLVGVSPTSGFHHAGYDFCGGFCSINGLLVTAMVLLQEATVQRIAILDCDFHYGDGSDDIIKRLRLQGYVRHYSAGRYWRRASQAVAFLHALPSIVEAFAGCDLILYQAGADACVTDPLGGFLTPAQLQERDEIVFLGAKRLAIPISWTLAGGYARPFSKVLAIHAATMKACASVYMASDDPKEAS